MYRPGNLVKCGSSGEEVTGNHHFNSPDLSS